MAKHQPPQRLSVRELKGTWQVLIVANDTWLDCRSEQQARTIGEAPVLELKALSGETGEALAQQLDATADAFERNSMGFGARFFRHSAGIARGENPYLD